ncbi:MAG: class I SAM-dependent methyltransferase [Candidatus Liptonbacteria bacterium]|nr:class I SAM-dependent methyltransferase [Candidatus Liptonbacteria bacterium]
MKFKKYLVEGDILTLDAGCGNGAFSFAAAQKGNRVIGIDFDKEKLGRCEIFRDYLKINPKQCQFKVFNLYELPKLNLIFDQIICFETLEHLAEDERVIRIFAEIIKPGGILHLCTPRKNRKLMYGEKMSEKQDGGHVRLGYEFENFKTMLEKSGISIVKSDKAVGFFGLIILNIVQWIGLSPLTKGLPKITKDVLSALILLPLYPLTFFDNLIPSQNLNIYVRAIKA